MDVNTKQVSITDITIKPVGTSMVYMVDTNGGKFSFFDKKQDGSNTKAFQQFLKFGFKKGDSVEVAYTEKVSDKINAYTGKPYVNYNVMYFVTADEKTAPAAKQPFPSTPYTGNTNNSCFGEIPTIQIDHEEKVKDNHNYLLMINNLSERLSVVEKFLEIPTLDENGEEKLKIEDCPF